MSVSTTRGDGTTSASWISTTNNLSEPGPRQSDDTADNASGSDSGGEPRRFDQLQLVEREFIGHFLEDPFLDLTDDRVLDEILGPRDHARRHSGKRDDRPRSSPGGN